MAAWQVNENLQVLDENDLPIAWSICRRVDRTGRPAYSKDMAIISAGALRRDG
jgi:hypothetical protein